MKQDTLQATGSKTAVPFNRPTVLGTELNAVKDASKQHVISGGGHFTRLCESSFEALLGSRRAFLTPSCTAALEMAALVANIGAGDEVIMPSFTFASAASAFALFGARIVFVDISPETLNIDHTKIEAAITPKTKAIVIVHYAGHPCEMETIVQIAAEHKILLIEDAAQAIASSLNGQALGSFGAMSAFSFHETKNVTSGGEGGVLTINDPDLVERANVVRDKGTDRAKFLEGVVEKYSWVDLGGSFTMNEISAAWLSAQLEKLEEITEKRRALNNTYRQALEHLSAAGQIEMQVQATGAKSNGHIFYLKTRSKKGRTRLLDHLAQRQIQATFHYVPLHSSPAGLRFGRFDGADEHTTSCAERLVRLPLYHNMSEDQQCAVIHSVLDAFR